MSRVSEAGAAALSGRMPVVYAKTFSFEFHSSGIVARIQVSFPIATKRQYRLSVNTDCVCVHANSAPGLSVPWQSSGVFSRDATVITWPQYVQQWSSSSGLG